MNTARIVVLAIAVGVGGALACPGERPDTATAMTGSPIAQARQTGAQSSTLQSHAYGHLAGQTVERIFGRLASVNPAPRHADRGDVAESTMRKQT
jgi:hypothetical protein